MKFRRGSGPTAAISVLAFSADGSLLAASNESGNVEVRNVGTDRGSAITVPIQAQGSPIWAAAFGAADLLALASDDGTTYLYQVGESGSNESLAGALADPGSGSQGVGALEFSPNGTYLVTGDTNGAAYLWHLG